MSILTHKLCSIQGRLFELSARQNFESDEFVKAYMNSDVAARFNSVYDRSQWMGEEYLLDELAQTYRLAKGKAYSPDVMFWMGYVYAYWSIVYGDPCRKIIRIADSKVMAENYAGLHTISADMAIYDLKTQYWSHGNNGSRLREEVYKKVIKEALNSRGCVTEYQRFVNSVGTDILFFLRNEAIRAEYEQQQSHNRRYITERMYASYIDYILELIDNANIPLRDKVEYSYVVKDMARNIANSEISNMQFVFLDSLESKLKACR